MNSLFTDKNNLDEVVFANRNKAYGAYALRKAYPENLQRSIYYTMVPLFLLFLLGLFLHNRDTGSSEAGKGTSAPGKKKAFTYRDEVKFSNFEIEFPSTESFVIVADKKVREPIKRKPIQKPEIRTAGLSTVGNLLAGASGIGGFGSTGTLTPPIVIPEPKPAEPQFLTISEIMPEFPGGMDALQAFIGKNLRYPDWAIENGIKGKVILSFVVTNTGEVDYVTIERGIGYGCDEEAARVIGEMPKWKPGIQNGKKVSVKMVLPIRFDHYQ